MTRVLYLARYRSAAMEQKIAFMAAEPDWQLCLFRPSAWRDEYGAVELNVGTSSAYRVVSAPLIGRPNDPHRALYRSLTFALRQIKPDLIHAEEEPDSLTGLQIAVARRLLAPRAKLLWHTWQNINRSKSWYVRAIADFNLRQADAVLCANHEAVEVLRQMKYARPTPVIPPQGVDAAIFHSIEPRSPHARFTIGFVGRFVPEKNIDLLLSAVQQLAQPVRIHLIGNGPQRAQLEEQARSFDAEIAFVEPVPLDQLAALYHQLDVLVLPSRTTPVWKEQFGRVLIEAMACGVPVIGSASGAIPEVIGDAGLIFPAGDGSGLTDCLQRLIDSPELHAELVQRGLARVQAHYTQERIAQQTLEFYRQVLA
jgi:glycosyltransferase involved in cell wall biosynthesis